MKLWMVLGLVLLCGTMPAQEAAARPHAMAADADPSFEVATIKPNAGAGHSLVNTSGKHYAAHNVTVNDLVKFAYGVHDAEIAGMPEWGTKESYDIAATMQPEGSPKLDQVRVMLKKLLAGRFGLKMHVEQRVLPVYVLTVGKDGPKMKVSESAGGGDSERDAPGGIRMIYTGATTKVYAQFLQQGVVDRAVIDKTGLTERYDFDVTFLPDGSMFGGRLHLPPNVPNAAPSLFTALEEIGLKLTPEKTAVDVVVVDAVARPTEN